MIDPNTPLPPDPEPDPAAHPGSNPAPDPGSAPEPAEPVQPYSRAELAAAFRPDRATELVLGQRQRLVESVARGAHLPLLIAVMLITSVLTALPYGLVLGWGDGWKVVALFVGSVLICVPSLHVFNAYLGSHSHPTQNLVLGMVVTSVAGMFTFGFFPILWFLDATMAEASVVTSKHISAALLTVSLLAGLGHLMRCVYADQLLKALRASPLLLIAWQLLVVFITYRMAGALELF